MDQPGSSSSFDDRLRRHGTQAWMLLGIILLAAIIHAALSALSGLVAPLVVAVVVGMLFVPVVDRLERVLPRRIAAALVLVGLVVAGIAIVVVALDGVIDQASQIATQLGAGWDRLQEWLAELGVAPGDAAALPDQATSLTSGLVGGLAGYATTVFSSAAALVVGTLVGLFLLFFVLADWDALSGWVAGHLGVGRDLGRAIVDDATFLTREYFVALTVSSIVTAVVIGAAAALLGVPLAVTIALVTFATSYVPYLGAIFSGAFAALIALGAGGPGDALVLLVVILVAQNIIQTVVQTTMTQSRLDLHPIVAFGSTIVGAALAGIIGATLSAPAVALAIRVTGRLRDGGSAPEDLPREA